MLTRPVWLPVATVSSSEIDVQVYSAISAVCGLFIVLTTLFPQILYFIQKLIGIV